MKIEDVIDCLNRHINDLRILKGVKATTSIVLHKAVFPESSFKSYKRYEYTLWYIKKSEDKGDFERYKILTLQNIKQTISGLEETIQREIDMKMCYLIFNWIGSNSYNQVILGENIREGESNETTKV